MVQNFSVFMDRSAAAKIRTTKFRSLASANYGLLMGVVPPEHQCKIKNHEIFFKGWEAVLQNFVHPTKISRYMVYNCWSLRNVKLPLSISNHMNLSAILEIIA